ncbi:MAG: PadR family transcriptional regulator [Gemmatimonadota bacterium]|jgi:PadR family transcriptional regulator PadR
MGNVPVAGAPADAHFLKRPLDVDLVYIDERGYPWSDVDNGDIGWGGAEMGKKPMGEVEHLVLLAVLRLGGGAFALDVLRELDREAGHVVSRGSLYKTMERLEAKGLLTWDVEDGSPERGGHPRRRFSVTEAGIKDLAEARARLMNMWDGVGGLLETDR